MSNELDFDKALVDMNSRDELLAEQHGLNGFRLRFSDLPPQTGMLVESFLHDQAEGIVQYSEDHLGIDLQTNHPRIVFGSRVTMDRNRGVRQPTSRERVESEWTGVGSLPNLSKYRELMDDNTAGHYISRTGTITIDATVKSAENPKNLFNVVCHELSHYKDHIDRVEVKREGVLWQLQQHLGQGSLFGVGVGYLEYATRDNERRARRNARAGVDKYFNNTIA